MSITSKLKVGSFIARREVVALVSDLGYNVTDMVLMGSTVIVEVALQGVTKLLEFELGNTVRDHSSMDLKEKFVPCKEVLESQVVKLVSIN